MLKKFVERFRTSAKPTAIKEDELDLEQYIDLTDLSSKRRTVRHKQTRHELELSGGYWRPIESQ